MAIIQFITENKKKTKATIIKEIENNDYPQYIFLKDISQADPV